MDVMNPEQAKIAEATASSPLFEGLSTAQRTEVVQAMFEQKSQPGQIVIEQGAQGDNFYVVSSGEFAAYLSQVNGGLTPVKTYGAGGSFGDLALMYNVARQASVVCTSAEAVLPSSTRIHRSIRVRSYMGFASGLAQTLAFLL